jgi:hypothetical protein
LFICGYVAATNQFYALNRVLHLPNPSTTLIETQGQIVLLAEETRKNRMPRVLRYEISSTDRNLTTETSSQFRWNFPSPVREVTEISVVSGCVPMPVSNITEMTTSKVNFSYNRFTLINAGFRCEVVIPVGNYTSATLATALQDAMNTAAGTLGFTVTLSPTTGKLTITGTAMFTLLFGSGANVDDVDLETLTLLKMKSPAAILGFRPATNYSSGPTMTLTAPNPIDTYLLTSRVYMYMNYISSQDLVAYNRGMGRREPSAIIYMDSVTNDRKYLNKDTYTPILVSKPAPISRIKAIDFSFEDFFGNPVNFGNREVSIVLELSVLEN